MAGGLIEFGAHGTERRMPNIDDIVRFYNRKMEKHGKLKEGYRKHHIDPEEEEYQVYVVGTPDKTTLYVDIDFSCPDGTCDCCGGPDMIETTEKFPVDRVIYCISFLQCGKTVKFVPHQNESDGHFTFTTENRKFRFDDHWDANIDTVAMHKWRSGLFSEHPNFYRILNYTL